MINIKAIIHPKDALPKMVCWHDLQSQYNWYERFGRAARPNKFLEIGVAGGYSSYAILSGCFPYIPGLVTWVDFCDGHGWDGNHDYAHGLIRGAFGVIPDDRLINSIEIHSFDNFYDLIHVDGDHTRDGCLYDLKLVSRFLVDDGHIICHDTNDPNVNDAIEDFLRISGRFVAIDFPQVRCGVKILHKVNEHLNNCCMLQMLGDNVQNVNNMNGVLAK